jgi:signal transduction histidine kinase
MVVKPGEHLPLHERLRLLPVPVLAMLVGVFVTSTVALTVSELSARAASGHAASVAQVRERLEAAAALRNLLVDAETGQRGYLLTQDRAYLEPFETATASFEDGLGRLAALTPPGALSTRVDAIGAAARERLATATTSVNLLEAGDRDAAVALVRSGTGKAQMDRFRDELAGYEAESEREIGLLRQQPGRTALWMRLVTWLAILLVLALLAIVTLLLMTAASRQRDAARQKDEEAARMQRLVEERTAELARISSYLQSASERDKADLARNLHDELGGLLTAARMDMAWLQSATEGSDPEVGRKLEQLSYALTEAMEVKRRVVESLHPALLDHFGLATALQSHFDETCRKAGLECETHVEEEIGNLPGDLAIALFRVGQESLTNIIRHARARTVELDIRPAGDDVELVIRDDGIGFDPAERQGRDAHGINGMRYRVQGLGGRFDVRRRPQGGTEVRIIVPRTRPAGAVAMPAEGSSNAA